ncbi:penicillin-binding protein 1A [Neisseriaceae bacterium TC5R-5]|nr:penicillin-binding protein 1A [Neisseriaceae bacterium TC5R-5]
MAGLILGGAVLVIGAVVIAIIITYPRLPSLDVLTDYRPKIPLRVYTADSQLIGEFGEERRSFVRIYEVPQLMKQAVMAAEDERFYQHGGVDYMGVLRAAVSNVLSGKARSGASTITMQVAKNFFLSSEKTFTRKFNEALLAFKIEHTLSKDQILELYFNQIYLGQRAYGFSAAAQVYYGKPMADLSVAEMAMLAGLPKAPSSYNPVVNPERAHLRQQYVLRRMYELNFITQSQYQAALVEPMRLANQRAESASQTAQYVAEMVRQAMYERYKESAYTEGLKVYTTLDSHHQRWAYDSLRAGLVDYDRKTGYRGPESMLELPEALGGQEQLEVLDEALSELRDSGTMLPAIVLSASPGEVRAYMRGNKQLVINGAGLDFVRSALNSRSKRPIRRGAVIRVQANAKGYWDIVEMPEVEGAFVSMDSQTGAIKSLVGGFDFNRSNFNHVTQAWRQPGSTFKPFIYSAALERGLTASSMINDAPLVFAQNGQRWEPKNDNGKFEGMMTMRRGLTQSKNLVSVRILMAVGTDYAQEYIERFGFSAKQHPAYLTMALGAGSVTPLQMAEGYAVFANGGFRTKGYFIDRIEDQFGRVLAKTSATIAGENAPQAIDPRNAFIMTSMLNDVVRYGTGYRAMSLGRSDLSGKTGTTSDWKDAWFVGYGPKLVAATWVGYDQPRTLGRYGYGGTAALPIWINYMANALKDLPLAERALPDGLVVRAGGGQRGGDEYYYEEYQSTNPELRVDNQGTVPGAGGDASAPTSNANPENRPPAQDAVEGVKDQLF